MSSEVYCDELGGDMPGFRVNTDNLKIESNNIYSYSKRCLQYADSISGLDYSFLSGDIEYRVKKTMDMLSKNVQHSGTQMKRLSSGLYEITNEYVKTERVLMGETNYVSPEEEALQRVKEALSLFFVSLMELIRRIFSGREKITPIEIENIVFDDEGQYGGDQGSAKAQSNERKLELWEIARRNLPLLPSENINAFLSELNDHGCGYVCIANVIFQYYLGREDDFLRDFGYPMYYNGDLNYDALTVDIFSKNIYTGDDGIRGLYPYDAGNIIEEVLRSKGHGVFVLNGIEMNANDVSRQLAKGNKVVIAAYEMNIYRMDSDGNLVKYMSMGGHGMEVTGVTEEGYYIVSSWGEKYYIKPDELLNEDSLIYYDLVVNEGDDEFTNPYERVYWDTVIS